MEKVLISFIGTGKKAQAEGKEEYQKARYKLSDDFIKDSSLITSVLYEYLKPDKLIVIGTPESIWAKLSEIAPDILETEPLYEKIWNVTWDDNSKIDTELLNQWEALLRSKLNADIKLYLIDSNDQEAEVIFDILYKEIPTNTNEVFLDITHAFRHFPMIAAFSLPVLKYLKNFQSLNLVYGKLVQYPNPSPVIFMKTPNKLMELLEAVSLTENSGNFEKFADIFNKEQIRELYLKTETNRKISNSQFNNLARNLPKDNPIHRVASEYLTEKVFKEVQGDSLAERMAKRAIFFADRNQFLKAYTLIYEALINTQSNPQIKGSEMDIYEEKKYRLEKSLNNSQNEIYHTIRRIRNTIVHGSEPPNDKIREIIQSEKKLREWVYEGYKLVKKLIKN